MASIVSVINQILSYADSFGQTDNPNLRDFDWTRTYSAIACNNPSSDKIKIMPGQTVTLFDGSTSTLLDATSVMDLTLVDSSVYKLEVTAGSSGFRTARDTVGAYTTAQVTVNNNSVASFNFDDAGGIDFAAVQIGDILRIAGEKVYDTSPYAFTSLNSGLWTIIAVDSVNQILQCVRKAGCPFEGITEAVTGIAASDVEIYTATGIQKGDKFEILNSFSSPTHRIYEVLDARPDAILFISTLPIPEETSVAYLDPIVNGESVIFFSDAKKMIYVEVDQDTVIRVNEDTTDANKVSPFEAGSSSLVGYYNKSGLVYKAEVVNKSVNTVNVLFFVAE